MITLLLHSDTPIARKRSKHSNEFAEELPATLSSTLDGGIQLSVFSNDTTSKLAGLFSALPL